MFISVLCLACEWNSSIDFKLYPRSHLQNIWADDSNRDNRTPHSNTAWMKRFSVNHAMILPGPVTQDNVEVGIKNEFMIELKTILNVSSAGFVRGAWW